MTNATIERTDQVAEFKLPSGCLVCGGDADVRITPGSGAYTFCPKCLWIGHPQIEMGGNQVRVTFSPGGEA
jgi:hypothetical protein